MNGHIWQMGQNLVEKAYTIQEAIQYVPYLQTAEQSTYFLIVPKAV